MSAGIRLYTFALSHYCEKARWALDWHGLPYREIGWPPGLHVPLARSLGASRSSVPILRMDGALVQGSDAILDWVGQQPAARERSLTPVAEVEAGRVLEERADRIIGVHVRRLIYAEALTNHPQLVKPWLLANTSAAHRLIGHLSWPVVRRLMISGMDATPQAAPDSRARLAVELDALDRRLAEGRRYLAGERFSRVDISVAALLAPLARPSQARVYHAMTLPPALESTVSEWHDRPIMRWVRDIYAGHREPPPARPEISPASAATPPD